ncbi:MAG: dTMP kinase [Candidatus Saccharibacteria bacterium]
MNRGKYIVIEGPEGVGKTSQILLLAERFKNLNVPFKIMREPDSQNDVTARAIRRLTQDPRYPMNTKTEVLLYNAARSQSLDFIRQCIDQGITCLVDRSYLTTLAIQYYARNDITDYNRINEIIDFAVGDTHPDLMIVMDASVDILISRVKDRNQGDRFDNLDSEFLERVRAGYLIEAKKRNLPIVYAVDSKDIISNQIWDLVSVEMNKEQIDTKNHVASSVGEIISQKTNSYKENPISEAVNADDDNSSVDSANIELKSVVTNLEDDVYAFTDKIDPVTIAAAMARLSRRGDDMRLILEEEFLNKKDKDNNLLKRVISAYGDDSVQQLVGQHIVVENASNLLTKKIERGRLAAYLEQSTRYIYYDKKNEDGKYKYFIPNNLSQTTKDKYIEITDQIFVNYSEIVHKLNSFISDQSTVPLNERDVAWKNATRAQACDAARLVLPVSTTSTVGIFASGQALESMIMDLMSDNFLESNTTGQKILDEARKTIPVFLERADIPERGGAIIAYKSETKKTVKRLAKKLLPKAYSMETKQVVLSDVWPLNELDNVSDMLYESSSLSLSEIRHEVSAWSYDRKLKVFNAYMGERLNRRHKPGRSLEKIHYSWDILCDYGIFRDLQRHRMVDDMEWQDLTPRYGYDCPEIIDDAGLNDLYEECFDLSLKLYSIMQDAGYHLEAQYATLLGHRMRWKVTMNAREMFHFIELRSSPQGHPGYRKIAKEMHDLIGDRHPIIASAMNFVNKGDNPELTRLAAEKYTQYKLNKSKNI